MLPIRDVNPTRARPLITLAIIVANIAVFFFIQPSESPEADRFAYEYSAIACELTTGHPLDFEEISSGECLDTVLADQPFPGKNIWLSGMISMFLHAGIGHLLFNMWFLWIFGNNVEEAFGPLGYLLFYAAAGVAATAGFVMANQDVTIPLVGASGAIAGVMGAYLVLFPRHLVLTLIFFYVTAIPSIVLLGIWFLTQFAIADPSSGVAWEAHVAGFVFGVLVTLPFRRRLLSKTLHPEPPVRAR
ncbi:rhomboid family intramembrane serine protease [bacterium]|nr:rhomboid family intramembrane serine protease [bacterium]